MRIMLRRYGSCLCSIILIQKKDKIESKQCPVVPNSLINIQRITSLYI